VQIYCDENWLLCRRECDQVAQDLRKAGIHAQAYHAGLSDNERTDIQQRWIREDRCKVRADYGCILVLSEIETVR
jgi:superfamily II DNA helicase RecQ